MDEEGLISLYRQLTDCDAPQARSVCIVLDLPEETEAGPGAPRSPPPSDLPERAGQAQSPLEARQ